MITVDATLTADSPVVALEVHDQSPSTAEHPPLVTLCVHNTSDTTIELHGGESLPLTQYSARDAAQPRRIIVFPTRLNAQQRVIPDAPTDGTWAMNEAFVEAEVGLTVRVEPGAEHCEEYAILTYRPYFDGYPPGEYVVSDDLTIGNEPATVELTITVS